MCIDNCGCLYTKTECSSPPPLNNNKKSCHLAPKFKGHFIYLRRSLHHANGFLLLRHFKVKPPESSWKIQIQRAFHKKLRVVILHSDSTAKLKNKITRIFFKFLIVCLNLNILNEADNFNFLVSCLFKELFLSAPEKLRWVIQSYKTKCTEPKSFTAIWANQLQKQLS